MMTILKRIPYVHELAMRLESGWRDFVRGHLVGQQRKVGFVGPVPFLLVMRWAMVFAVGIRFLLDKRTSAEVWGILVAMGVLALLNIPLAYRHRHDEHDSYHRAIILSDLVLISFLVQWAEKPQSDVFLLYMLPLLTATEYLGGWAALGSFAGVSFGYGTALFFHDPIDPARIVIFITREVYLAFFVALTLCLFKVTSASLGDFHAALQRVSEENREAVDLDAKLDELMRRITDLGFEFVGLSMVDLYQKLVVMTKAVNIPAGWMRQSRRPLAGGDIMAYLFDHPEPQTPDPYDERFERKTWRVFRHDLLARAYAPVLRDGQVVAILQAGWERSHKGDVIGKELVAQLCALGEEYEGVLSRARPHAFLERLCQIVMNSIHHCTAVTLHICQNDQLLFAARAGTYTRDYVMNLAEEDGPVRRVIRDDVPEWLDAAGAVKQRHPSHYAHGCRSLAALRLEIGPETKGALLVHFTEEQRFGNWFREQVKLLARGVEFAIQNRLLLTRFALLSSRAWMQSRLKTVEDALGANAPLEEVLQRVADHFLYNLEADLVTLYQFRPDRRDFRVPPVSAGEVFEPKAMEGMIQTGSLLWECLQNSSQFYTDLPPGFRAARQDGTRFKRFADRENIRSCAVLVLQTADPQEKAGLIFVNYRRRFDFSPEDRIAMLTLASSAAVAIRTARSIERRRSTVEAMQEIEKVIAASGGPPDLDLVLQHVLDSACKVAGASEGWTLWFTSNREHLERRASFGAAAPEPLLVTPAELGPVGKAVTSKRFQLVAGEAGNRSILAVPLRDREDVLGVVLLHSGEHQVFTAEDAFTVEMLGVLAVVGARFTELYRPLVALSAVAARLQERPFDLDTALRIILTGVTADEGLGFTRAVVFLQGSDPSEAKGRLAVGPLSAGEAQSVWTQIEGSKRDFGKPGDQFLNWLLDEAERTSREIREGTRRDSELSEHVQSLNMPCSLVERSLGDYSMSSCQPLLTRGEWQQAFACVPLMVKDTRRGFLLADRNFQGRSAGENDVRLLRLFADIAAIAVENLMVRTPATESERLEQWRHLFSEARHEVGTRLSILDGAVDLFHRDLDSGSPHFTEWDTFLKAVRHRIANASWMAKKIQPWKGEPVAIEEDIDLVHMLEGVVANAQLVFHRATIELEEDVPPFMRLRLKCDPLELEGAFAELLRNAGEALDRTTPRGDRVTVRVGIQSQAQDAAMARVEVEDNGPGIPVAMRDRIFEPQVSVQDSSYHGYGLVGAKRRVESLGGSIRVTGPETPGACFEILLPVRLQGAYETAEA